MGEIKKNTTLGDKNQGWDKRRRGDRRRGSRLSWRRGGNKLGIESGNEDRICQFQALRNSTWFCISSADFVAINLSNLRICSPTE